MGRGPLASVLIGGMLVSSIFQLTYIRRLDTSAGRRLRAHSLPLRAAPLLALLPLAAPPAVLAGDGWRFRLSPYFWFAELKGDVTTSHGGHQKGMARFTVAKGGLMYEASIAGGGFTYEAL